jgi:hypothetical protein
MAKAKKTAKTQAQRMLELAKKNHAGESAQAFSRSMGKHTLNQNARKAGKGEIGG